ncbi:MAG: phosphoheptose isomerase [Rhodospirillaceae bacterium]|nr:MAG: phosphoheptose isomerase [Rhodospirillaceae bacterium]
MDLKALYSDTFDRHEAVVRTTRAALEDDFVKWVELCRATLKKGGKILFFGNGGSASDAQHLATELTVRFVKERPAIAAIALTTDTSTLTAICNDWGLDLMFSRQVEALCNKDDLVVGISTSGTSLNVLKGLQAAQTIGAKTVGLGGRDGGQLGQCCDLCLIVPSDETARIQEMHITLGHMLCAALEEDAC